MTDGRTVRIGNAAQTLHPVAGQGLNLGLRDALRAGTGARWRESAMSTPSCAGSNGSAPPDRWATIATTDFLARSFTWALPGAATARGVGLAALQALAPIKSAIARQMMFGSR